MAEPAATVDVILGLIKAHGLRIAAVDERTDVGKLLRDAIVAAPDMRRVPGRRRGPKGVRVDLLHIGAPDGDALAELDRDWPALAPRALVIGEGAGRPALERAFRRYAEVGVLLLTLPEPALAALTESEELADGLAAAGWMAVPPVKARTPAPKGRSVRLLHRAAGPTPAPLTTGDTPEAVADALGAYAQQRRPGHIRRHLFEEAVVYGDMTLVGQEGLVREMRRLVDAERSKMTRARFADRPLPRVEAGLLIGVSSHSNYFHWVTESLFSLWLAKRSLGLGELPGVTPPLEPYAVETLTLLGLSDAVLAIAPDEARRFGQLVVLSPVFGDLASAPSSLILGLYDDLLGAALGGVRAPKPTRRLYISRADSLNRPLQHETALAAALESQGFETIVLSGRSLSEQARLFAEAAVVVGPHGAGLTNLGFCRPGTKVLELTPSHYFNSCFLGLSHIAGLDHRVYVGTAHGKTPLRHKRVWSVRLDEVLAVTDALVRD